MAEQGRAVLLGTRGSVPAAGQLYAKYGQETTCLLLSLCGETVIVDGGTGLMRLEQHLPRRGEATLILTHSHIDHLLGLPMWPWLFRPEFHLHLLGRTRNSLTVSQQIERLMSPPLWPVKVNDLPASITFGELEEQLQLGGLTVRSLEGTHPGGVSLLRFDGGGRSVAVMTDCTVDCPRREAFLDFARDCDLLLIDGQYSPEEWPRRSGFGHSTWVQAAEFGRDCGARCVRVIHHDPQHTDDLLDLAQPSLTAIHPNCSFGCAGEEITL